MAIAQRFGNYVERRVRLERLVPVSAISHCVRLPYEYHVNWTGGPAANARQGQFRGAGGPADSRAVWGIECALDGPIEVHVTNRLLDYNCIRYQRVNS
jgi:hypothetical protein